MKLRVPTKQLSAISLLVATGATLRVVLNWAAFTVPIPIYGVLIKIGLSESLAFTCGFVFGPVQGFVTGFLIIVVSDLFTWAGVWTPFIAAIIGLLGIWGGVLRCFKKNPSILFLGVTAITLTLVSELLQCAWFAYFFSIPITIVLMMGIRSMVTAIVNNTILFTTVVPRIIKVLREMVLPNTAIEEKG